MTSPIRVVLDTDTYNEVDDQFALAHLLLSTHKIDLEAVYAAPFFNHRSTGPKDGMERSYEEIHRVLDLIQPEKRPAAFRGSTSYLSTVNTPVESEAVDDLVERALAMEKDERLTVVAIAAATNVASALIKAPEIADNIRIVWLGGNGLHWPGDPREFNLKQDPYAARVLLTSQAPLVLLPCYPVVSHLITTVAELEEQLAPFSKLGRYLTDIVRSYEGNPPGWSKIIWDIAASAYVIEPKWIKTDRVAAPRLKKNLAWDLHSGGRVIDVAREVDRNGIFADFFAKARVPAPKPLLQAV